MEEKNIVEEFGKAAKDYIKNKDVQIENENIEKIVEEISKDENIQNKDENEKE